MMMTNSGLKFLLFLCLGLLARAPVAFSQEWDWYVAGFVGGAFPQDTDFRKKEPPEMGFSVTPLVIIGTATPPEITTKNRSLNASAVLGSKAGVCPPFFSYLCAELEFDYFRPNMGGTNPFPQTTFTSVDELVTRIPLARFDFRVHNLGLNLTGRLPLLKEPDYPLGGRLHLYLGAGPSFVWTTAKDRDCLGGLEISGEQVQGGIELVPGFDQSKCNQSDTDFSVGVEALTGAKLFLTKNAAFFIEYKFQHWRSDFKFSNAELPGIAFNVHLVYLGVAFHF